MEKSRAVLEGLMNRRTIMIEGEITGDSVQEVRGQLLDLQMASSERITLIINSGGGATFPALGLADFMSCVITAPIRGVAVGLCGSAATFIFLHCNERLSTPNTRFLIHSSQVGDITIRTDQSRTVVLEQLLHDAKSVEEQVTKLYMKRLGMTRAAVKKLLARGNQEFDELMTAEEAVAIGLATEIIHGKLDTFTK